MIRVFPVIVVNMWHCLRLIYAIIDRKNIWYSAFLAVRFYFEIIHWINNVNFQFINVQFLNVTLKTPTITVLLSTLRTYTTALKNVNVLCATISPLVNLTMLSYMYRLILYFWRLAHFVDCVSVLVPYSKITWKRNIQCQYDNIKVVSV